MQNNVIVTADVHMKSRLWTNYAAIQGDSEAALTWLTKVCNPSDTVLVSCGDLFDTNKPTSNDVGVVKHNLEKFKKTLFVSGNHDNCVPAFADLTLTNAYHLNTREPYRVGKLFFFGVDYQSSKEALLESLLEAQQSITKITEGQCVLILHQAVKEFLSFEGSYIIDRKELFSIIPDTVWVFVGDIHVSQEFGTPGNSYLCSPGPLVPQDIGQAKHKQRVLEICPDSLNIKSVPVSVRDYHFIDLVEAPEYDIEGSLVCIQTDKPLKPVVVIIVDTITELDRSLHKSDRYILVVKTSKEIKEEIQKAASSSLVRLEDAIMEEIDVTEPTQAGLLKPLVKNLISVKSPDELLTKLCKKWEVTLA